MRVNRWSVRLHKWIALVVGVQILVWVAGGLLMTALPIERVRGEHKVAEHAAPQLDPSQVISLPAATRAAGLSRVEGARLGVMLGEPVWRVAAPGGAWTIDAVTGEVLSPLSNELAARVAEHDYAGSGELRAVRLLTDPPAEYGRPGPVWQARFDDRDRTTLYIDPGSGEVRARRSATWRVFDLAWRLHVMDYDDGVDFNHPLVVTAAGAALIVVMSGLVLLVLRTRRTVRATLAARAAGRRRATSP
jgi:uncharacterized iron-regulated membrane protein